MSSRTGAGRRTDPFAYARSLKGLSDADVAALQRLVDDQVEENLGMAMIYTIIAAAQEWLRDKARPFPSI